MLQDLHDQESLFGFHHIGQFVLFHFEDDVFQLRGELAALVLPQIPALFGGRPIGITLGDLREIFAVLHALQRRVRFLL